MAPPEGFGDPQLLFGRATPRVDGAVKVTGAARYASDEPLANAAYAYLVTSTIARGRVTGFRLAASHAVPGVLDILTHETAGTEAKSVPGMDGGPPTPTLESDQISCDGQIIAIVVAETYEAAREAANKVEVEYAEETPSATFDSPGAVTEPHTPMFGPDPQKGDAAKAYAAAPVKLEAHYTTPTQHHNALELFTTACAWEGTKLTVYEPTQFMWGTKHSVAAQLDIEVADVRAISRYIGGAFGSKGPNSRTGWIAVAARRVGRPVKLMATRDQGFTVATYRAETRHHVKLAADKDGRLQSLSHTGWELTSRSSGYNVSGVGATAGMYACPNIETAGFVVHADRNTPGFMRAPPETPYMFALESAMDELSYEIGIDPIELRRINDTQVSPAEGKPFSSRALMECYDQAAEKFGWRRRNPQPASMVDGEWLVGFGCATACYPSNIGPAAARLAVTPDTKVVVELAAHEIGTGAYTVVAMVVAQSLGLPIEHVTVYMGDSDLPPVMLAGGSNNAASTVHVATKACEEVRQRVAAASVNAADSPFHGADPATLILADGQLCAPDGRREPLGRAVARTGNRLEVNVDNVPDGMPAAALQKLYGGQMAMLSGTGRKDVSAYAFGAHFIEVRVHARTREIRVPRVVSAFAAGTIINPMAARSQFIGGTIWGISAALFEATEVDPRTARYTNDNLADYMIPVNADVPSIEIIMIPEKDERVNPLGIKGIGEVGIVGMNAAVANAVFHATGKRIRELPIRAEKLL